VQVNGLILQVHADAPGLALERALLEEVEHEAAALLAAEGALGLRVAVCVRERLGLGIVEGLQVPWARRGRGRRWGRRRRAMNRQRRLQLLVTRAAAVRSTEPSTAKREAKQRCVEYLGEGAVNGSLESASAHLKPTSRCMRTEGRGLECARSEALCEAGKSEQVRSAWARLVHCADSPRAAKSPRKCVD
jgi:hypothetical protein